MRAHMAITAIHTREKTVGECGCLPVMMINGCYSVGPSSEQRQTLNFLLQLNHNWCFCFKNLKFLGTFGNMFYNTTVVRHLPSFFPSLS